MAVRGRLYALYNCIVHCYITRSQTTLKTMISSQLSLASVIVIVVVVVVVVATTSNFRHRIIIGILVISAFQFVGLFQGVTYASVNNMGHLSSDSLSGGAVDLQPCTNDQLETIKQQLPPGDCIANIRQPWSQRCSLTYATKCPDAVWLNEYYKELHSIRGNEITPGVFTGLFVGCNKGMDAVNTMRMGSGNPMFDKQAWRKAMTKGGKSLDKSVCDQANSPQFDLSVLEQEINGTKKNDNSMAQLHCIEPMPTTAHALYQAAQELQWDQHGFIVTHAAVSKNNGIVPFPSGNDVHVGKENKGIGNCKISDGVQCVDVNMYSLDTYVAKYIPHDGPIHHLSIDVEGFDMDVLLGGSNSLKRVHYLEFEYNWMGSWKGQKLADAIGMLDNYFDFTCYWPGFNSSIWRITNCWLDHYELHYWSNVACVKRHVENTKKLAERMEQLFHETVAKGDRVVLDYDHRYTFG